MHSAPNLGSACAYPAPCRRPPWPYRRCATRALELAVPHVSQPRVPYRRAHLRAPAPYCSTSPDRVAPRIATKSNGQATRLSRYTHLYRDPVSQQPGPRACATCTCARVGCVVASFWSCHGRAVAVSWLATSCRGLAPCAQASLLCYLVSRYKNFIVTQTGKRGSSLFQFPTTFFFFSFLLLEKLPKNILFYLFIFFIFQYTQINLLKFILFIFLQFLHAIKPWKISSPHFFSSHLQ